MTPPLFDPARHEPLADTAWDASAAREAIDRIANDALAAWTVDGLWPLHPLDRSPERAETLKPLYYGAAGVLWALRELHRAGLSDPPPDLRAALATLLERHRDDSLRLAGAPVLAYPTGDAGILLLQSTVDPSPEIADALHDVIERNLDHPTLGFAWGGAGSMLAAVFALERTGDARFERLARRGFDTLWRAWTPDDAIGCHLFTQDLYGRRGKRLGALHGLAGIVGCMLRTSTAIATGRRDELVARAGTALAATAVREGAFANWPVATEGDDAQRLWLQYCSGAPGMVSALAALPPDPEVDALFIAAGELIWHAGPVAKLPSLCHGVSGSGYAFLKLFARTGDERWLERARCFAMHGIAQAERGVAEHGQRKFSLFTGDLGLAMFLADCVAGGDRFPTFDDFGSERTARGATR